MRITTMAFGAATILLLSGAAYAQGSQPGSPCAQQTSRANNGGNPPDSQPGAQAAARGNDSGAPPDSQNASAQQAARGNDSGAPPNSQAQSQLAANAGNGTDCK